MAQPNHVTRYGKLNGVSSSSNLVAGLVIGTIVFALILIGSWRGVKNRSANRIVSQLQKSDLPYDIKVGIGNRVWNPSPEGGGAELFGPAQARYTLDEHDVIHLRFEHKSRPAQYFSGPLPDVNSRVRNRRRAD
jgi:hypothetical protein